MEAQHDVSLSMQSIQVEHVNAIKELTQTTQQGNFSTILMILRSKCFLVFTQSRTKKVLW